MPPPTATSIKLDPDTKARMQALAISRQRTSHWMMREAIDQYLEREEQRQKVAQEVLTRWQAYRAGGEYVDAETANNWLERLETGEFAPAPYVMPK